MVRIRIPYVRFISAAVVVALCATTAQGQDECQCSAPGAESSRIASTIGGGLFAGLIAAVIPFHHAGALAAAPAGAGAPSELTQLSDSTDVAPGDSTKPRQLATTSPNMATPGTGGAAPLTRGNPHSAPVTALPSMSPTEATAEGMIAPRTATLLPALAMIGVGALLMGIFFLRVRRPE